ncbi:MAG: exosortase A [Rhodoferax sp.]|nr:exosortase A [Rhodoferax sp.]
MTDAVADKHRAADGWLQALLALAAVLAAVLLVYWPTAVGIVTIWYRSETFTHAFLVPPIVGWIIWRRRQEVARIAPAAQPWILVPMLGLCVGWLLGDLTAINSVTQFAFVGLLVLAVPLVLGLRVAWALLFPLAYLFFGVPTGEFLMPLFMDWTADFTVTALRLSGIPVVREGLNFVIPSGNWSVVEACSGIRYLIASVTVGTLYAHLNYQSTLRRIVFVLVAIAVPVVANWLRAYMIVMIGHLSGNTLAVGVDHLIYGWAFFGVVIMIMFLVGGRWAEPELPYRAPAAWTGPGAGAQMSLVAVVLMALAGSIAVASPLAAKRLIEASARSGAVALAPPERLGDNWKLSPGDDLGFKPRFVNPTSEFNAVYARDGARVGLYLAYYRNQTYNSKLVSSDNVMVPSEDTIWGRERSYGALADLAGVSTPLRATDLRRLSDPSAADALRLTGWQVYWVDGTLTANDYLAKAYSAFKQLAGRGDESAVVIVYAAGDTPQHRQTLLRDFLRDNFGAISTLLQTAGAAR